MIHAGLGALIGQQQAALVGVGSVALALGKLDAAADVIDGRVTDVRSVLVIEVAAHVILHPVVAGHLKGRLELVDAVFSLLNIAAGLGDGFVELPIGLLQVYVGG